MVDVTIEALKHQASELGFTLKQRENGVLALYTVTNVNLGKADYETKQLYVIRDVLANLASVRQGGIPCKG